MKSEDEAADDELVGTLDSEELESVETLLELSSKLELSDGIGSLEIEENSVFEEGSADIFEFSTLEAPPAEHEPSSAAKERVNR